MKPQESVKNGSSMQQLIATSGLSAHDRQYSLDAMRTGEIFVDGLLWTIHRIEDLGHFLVRPAVKH